MNFIYNLILVLAIGSAFVILGRIIKIRFIEWIGRAVCMLAIAVPPISFFIGFMDSFK